MKFPGTDPFKDVQELGRKDGGFDQDHAYDFVIMKHGPRPVMRPGDSLEQALWVEGSNPTRLNAWTADLHATEDALVKHPPSWLLLGLLVLVALIEFESGLLFWKDRGVNGFPRIVIAFGTAVTTVFLPWMLVEFGHHWKEQ